MPSPADHILSDPTLASVLPASFAYGAASASHQIEGHIAADGKGPNVWDIILKDKKGENGEDACNSYEQWQEDVDLLKLYGANTYRFSISWARIFPDGMFLPLLPGSGPAHGIGDCTKIPSEAGIKYYSTLVDALLKANIQPCITIFHWDHPQALEDKYGSFSDERIVDDFVGFAKVLFERLGDRCKFWITINEVGSPGTSHWA
jgi:beta-glucosidase